MSLDPNGKIIEANLAICSLLDFERKYILDHAAIQFVDYKYRTEFYKFLNTIKSSLVKVTLEVELIKKDESRIFVCLEGIIPQDRETVYLIAVVDISERRAIEERTRKINEELDSRVKERSKELQESNANLKTEINERKIAEKQLIKAMDKLAATNKELEEFTMIISHDLQEPLHIISNLSQIILRRYQNKIDDDTNQCLNLIVESTQRMKQLIVGLLNLVHLNKKEPIFNKISSEKILQQALGTLEQSINSENAVVTNDPLPEIFADPIQMSQLFQNIIGNAVKYRREVTPEIHISCRKGKNEFVFSIKDNGIGIDPMYYDKIFLIFQKLHNIDQYSGIGIGLTICKKIVERHKGKIWVESQPGQGSVFFFSIPAVK